MLLTLLQPSFSAGVITSGNAGSIVTAKPADITVTAVYGTETTITKG